MLNALYYPFSRCIDASALKQLLLVFDSVTFLDPVNDDEWRAKLFKDLEVQEDKRFRKYRDLHEQIKDLRQEGVIVLRNPEELEVFKSPAVVASTLSDLLDEQWCDVASRPEIFRMPHGLLDSRGRATWQIFSPKLPYLFQKALLHEKKFKDHLIQKGITDSASWTVSYEAGSAVTLNLHTAAAGELSLSPVTDSVLHHRLLLRKLTRSITDEASWKKPDNSLTKITTAQQTAMNLIQELLPRSSLEHISFEFILEFRNQTSEARKALMKDLSNRLSSVSHLDDPGEILVAQQDLCNSITQELRDYRGAVANTRDKLWPNLVGSTTVGGVTAGSLSAVALELLAGGPLGVVAGSIAGATLSLLKSTLDYRAELKHLERSATPSITYLSRVVNDI